MALHLPPDLMSFRTLIDGLIAFLVIGLTEVVIKPLATAAIGRPLKRALPDIFERLDNEMPVLLRTADPEVMTAEIAASIAQATGNPATARQIEQVVALYSPIKAVLRNVR
jgi:hypothetical protein